MKHCLTLVTASILIAAATAFGAAGKAKSERPQKGPPPTLQPGEVLLPPRVLETLALNAEQQAKYDALLAEWKKEAEKFWADHAQLRDQMREAREARDRAKMGKLMKELQPLQDARKRYVEKVRAFLTDEQKKKLDDMREEFESRRPEGSPQGKGRKGAAPSK